MAEFSAGDLQNLSISHDLFSDITADERFLTLPEEELANLRGKNQTQNTSKYKNLAECFQRVELKCSVTKRES